MPYKSVSNCQLRWQLLSCALTKQFVSEYKNLCIASVCTYYYNIFFVKDNIICSDISMCIETHSCFAQFSQREAAYVIPFCFYVEEKKML